MYVRDAEEALHDERSPDGGATSGSEASCTYIGLIRGSLSAVAALT